MKKEYFKIIIDFNDYLIGDCGTVISLKKNGWKVMKPINNGNDYLKVGLSMNGEHHPMLVHRLVAEAFVPNPENKPYIDHIDGNPQNNFYLNLRWCTQTENMNNPIARKRISKSKKGIPNIKISQSNRNNPKKSKKVVQLDKNNNFIKEWLSTRDIERNTEYSHEFIASCCRGNHEYAYGYKWMYIADYKKMFGQ